MDGRRFRRWFLCGGVLAAAVGCNRGSYHDPSGLPRPGSAVGALPPPGVSRSMWNGGAVPGPGAGPAGIPVEPAAARPKKTGPMPDFETAAADTLIEQAFADPPPPNRDGLLDLARTRYQRALSANPKHSGALLGLARMYARLGDRERSSEAYRKYLEVNPKDAAAHHEISLAHGQWRDWDGAVNWCEAALRLDPENRTYRKSLGFCLARAGRWDEGFAALCRVMPEAQARHNMAGLLDHLGQSEASREQLQLALRADPNYAPAREFLAELDRPAAPGVPSETPNPIQQAGFTRPR